MMLFPWIIIFYEIIGLALGVSGFWFVFVVCSIDAKWRNYFHDYIFFAVSVSLVDDSAHQEYPDTNNFSQYGNLDSFVGFKLQQKHNTKWDNLALRIVCIIVPLAAIYIITCICCKSCRMKLSCHKIINKLVAVGGVLVSSFLLFSLLSCGTSFYHFIENAVYNKSDGLYDGWTEPKIHWPCQYSYLAKNASSSSVEGVPHHAPHTCQYKFYKILAIGVFLVYAVISMAVLKRVLKQEALIRIATAGARVAILPFQAPAAAVRHQRPPRQRGRLGLDRIRDSNGNFNCANLRVQSRLSSFPDTAVCTVIHPPCTNNNCAHLQNANSDLPPPYQSGTAGDRLTTLITSTTAVQGQPQHEYIVIEPQVEVPMEEPPPSYSNYTLAHSNLQKH